MLQRDPKRRASLEEIENHAWLQGVDPSPATKYNIPLVSYKNLSEEEHNSIIQRLVLGDIADRDAIVEYVSAHCRAWLGFLQAATVSRGSPAPCSGSGRATPFLPSAPGLVPLSLFYPSEQGHHCQLGSACTGPFLLPAGCTGQLDRVSEGPGSSSFRSLHGSREIAQHCLPAPNQSW